MAEEQHDWRPTTGCRPGGCQMWQAQQEIRVLRKQLVEAMKKVAEKTRELKIAEKRISDLELDNDSMFGDMIEDRT